MNFRVFKKTALGIAVVGFYGLGWGAESLAQQTHKGNLVEKTFDCSRFYKEDCDPRKADPPYQENGQSRGANFEPGQTSALEIVVYEGHDYRITLCRGKFKKPLRMKLKAQEGKVLYDNKAHDMASVYEFSVTETQSLTLAITTPGEELEVGSLKTGVMGCIGVLIEHRPTPGTAKTGF